MMTRTRAGVPITLQMMGGLGNQMFIAAFGFAAASKFERTLRFDVGFGNRTAALRDLELPGLDAFAEVVDSREFVGMRRLVDAGFARGRVSRRSTYLEHGRLGSAFGYDPTWHRVERATRVRGYFQSWRYFDGVEELVRHRMQELLRSQQGDQLLSDIHETVGTDFVAVHVRRGDYLTDHSLTNFGLCSTRYYTDGVRLVRSLGASSAPLVVFSDSPEQLPTQVLEQASFVVPTDPRRPSRADLFALSQAGALVGSNSSFSWWAAYLQDSSERPVVVPRPWFRRGDYAGSDLLLPHWMALGA